MKKRYTGAIQGQGGLFQPIKKAWSTRFDKLRAFMLIPERNEKIEISLHYDANLGADKLLVTRTNYQTGKKQTISNVVLLDIAPDKIKNLKS